MTMQFGSETAFSNKCGVTLMNTPIGRVVATVMGAKDGVELTEYPSMIRVDGVGLLDFDYAELTEALGSEFDGSVFEEISSTHYGGWSISTTRRSCSPAPRTPPSTSAST